MSVLTRETAVLGKPITGPRTYLVLAASAAGYAEFYSRNRLTYAGGVPNFYNTIDEAVNQCVDSRYDTIKVLPGHTESISSATSLVADVDGVTIQGIGRGVGVPTLTYTNTAGSLELDGDNVVFENFRLRASVSAVVVGVNVDGHGVILDGVRMDWDATGDDFVTMVDVDAVNNVEIVNSQFIAEDTAGCAEAIRLDDCDNVLFEGNSLYGDFTDAAIIGEGAAGTNLRIKGNDIYNSDTTAGMTVDLNVAFTGLISQNNIGTLYATDPESTFDPGSCLSQENYITNAVDESGALVPVTVST